MSSVQHAMLLLASLSFVALCSAQFNGLPVIRNTTLGQVLGSIDFPVPTVPLVEKYFGIPYAKPPIGNLRFEEPEKMAPWEPKILQTVNLHPACPQIDQDMIHIAEHRPDFFHTDEDCLYLNVFVPVITNASREVVPTDANDTNIPDGTTYGHIDEPMAVLVFIHGGSNVVGTANMFDGDILAAVGKIIVVTINYRLAALGFLGTGDPDFPGNYGILDQIAALHWVQDNIAFFNGDPRKVTVMGQSAGATDVGVLLVSPLVEGLFRTAICMSGAPTSPITTRWVGHDSMAEVTSLGVHFNCSNLTLAGIKECLKKVDVIQLTKSFPAYDWHQFPAIVGGKVLPKQPIELLKTGKLNAENFVIGSTRDEAGKWSYEMGGFDTLYNLIVLLHVVPAAIDFKELVRFEYIDGRYPQNATTNTRIGSMAYADSVIDCPTVETLQILTSRNISLHQYRWEWRSELFPSPEIAGVSHGTDLFYLFGSPLLGHMLYNYTIHDKDMSILFMRQWGHFVTYSTFDISSPEWTFNPSQEDLRYDNGKAYIRFLSNNATSALDLGYNLKPRKTKFWTSIIRDLEDQINRTLTNWNPNPNPNPNPNNTTTKAATTDRPLSPKVDVDELMKQKNLFLILFIVFLVLSCILLLLFMLICVMFCTTKNSSKYSMK